MDVDSTSKKKIYVDCGGTLCLDWDCHLNKALVTALSDAVSAGHEVVLFTSDTALFDSIFLDQHNKFPENLLTKDKKIPATVNKHNFRGQNLSIVIDDAMPHQLLDDFGFTVETYIAASDIYPPAYYRAKLEAALGPLVPVREDVSLPSLQPSDLSQS